MKKHNQTIIISSYDEPRNPFYGGGGAVAVHETAKRLQKHFSVSVICGTYPRAKDYTLENVSYHHIGIPFFGGKIGQLAYQFLLPLYVLTHTFDLWIESFTPPFSIALLPLFTKKPIIGLVHMLSGEDMKRKYKLPFDRIEKAGLRYYHHFIVLTEENKQIIQNINAHASIAVIPNGVSIPKQKETTAAKRKHILYIGRVEINQKGLDLLLHAYRLIISKTNIPLMIAGTGAESEMKKLKELLQTLSLEGSVKLVGKISNAAKERAYQEAYCVVIPSRFETFSLVALETLARARALVTFSIAGLRWIPQDIRVVIDKWNTKKLSKALYEVTTQQAKRTALEKKGKAFASNFTWEEVEKKYLAYMTTIIKENV